MKTDRISFYINRKGDRDLYVIDLEQNRNIIVYSENRRELELFVKGLRPSCSVLVLERDEIKNQLIGLGENKAIENERLYIIKEEDIFATCSWKALTDLIQSDHRMMILTNTQQPSPNLPVNATGNAFPCVFSSRLLISSESWCSRNPTRNLLRPV